MIVHRKMPLNAEPRPNKLAAAFRTLQTDFYIRNHGNIPKLNKDGYRLRVGSANLTFVDLEQLPKKTVTAVMQCAGNRRADMAKYKHVSGDSWQAGAISNAEWTGILLSDVLKKAGIGQRAHVAFASHDEINEEREHFNFGVSIPMEKAMAPETILAFSMNGEPLTPEHGFPVRLVTPGYAGVRSPKWLESIVVQDSPSDNHIQQKEYKLFPPEVIKEKADFSKGIVINDMPLNSAILEPIEHATVRAGRTTVRGYAICTSRSVAKVEISADKGRTWTAAKISRESESPWTWIQWMADIDLAPGAHELMVRAWDDQGHGQPESAAAIFNFGGYLMNAWHHVNIHAKDGA